MKYWAMNVKCLTEFVKVKFRMDRQILNKAHKQQFGNNQKCCFFFLTFRYVWTIKIPVMCLSSVNDPVIPREQIPYDEVKKRPNALLVTTEYGGHCGFKEQSGLFGMDNWADKLTLDYLMTAKDYAPARQKEIVWQEMTSQFDRK